LEEAAYCDPGLVSEVVVPLLSMQQSVLLCISTILDSGNHYTKMMELVDDYGNTVFETIKITLVRARHFSSIPVAIAVSVATIAAPAASSGANTAATELPVMAAACAAATSPPASMPVAPIPKTLPMAGVRRLHENGPPRKVPPQASEHAALAVQCKS